MMLFQSKQEEIDNVLNVIFDSLSVQKQYRDDNAVFIYNSNLPFGVTYKSEGGVVNYSIDYPANMSPCALAEKLSELNVWDIPYHIHRNNSVYTINQKSPYERTEQKIRLILGDICMPIVSKLSNDVKLRPDYVDLGQFVEIHKIIAKTFCAGDDVEYMQAKDIIPLSEMEEANCIADLVAIANRLIKNNH